MKRISIVTFSLASILLLVIGCDNKPTLDARETEEEHEPCAENMDDECLEEEEPKPDHPGEAVIFRRLQQADENGDIPADGLAKALLQVEQMRSAQGPQPRGAGISPNEWTWLGPGNVGGRIRSILTHPTDPNRLWVGSVSGGIWKTTDAGASWHPVDDFMGNLAVATLVMDPGDPNIIYAGTGEGFYNFDGIRGAGVFKSTDGGDSWSQLGSTAGEDWYFVNRLSISPDGATILAATGSGIWRSTNGGLTWEQELEDWRVKDIDFHPNNSVKAIASGSDGTAWYSTDGGKTWNLAAGLPGQSDRVETAFAPSEPNIVYASVSHNDGEVWKSWDGGATYSLVMDTGTGYLGGQGWYDNIVWVDPSNADNVVVGGSGWLRRSDDGGLNFTDISTFWQGIHPDHHAIVEATGFNADSNTTVYFGNDGGIYRTDNIYSVSPETGWEELNNNLGITQFYGAAGNPDTGVIVGGTQDNGTPRFSGDTENWTFMNWGDGGYVAADPTDPDYFYGEYIGLSIYRSTDGGRSSSWIHEGLDDTYNCANFIAPFILDPNNPNTLLAGGCRLWRSTNVKDAKPTWAVIKPALVDNSISAIAVAPGNSDIIWVGYGNGEIFKTANGTAENPDWQQVDSDRLYLPYRFITRLTIDPGNPNVVYVTFGGFDPDNIWRTDDDGLTWQDVTGDGVTGLPDVTVRSLVIHPYNTDWIYVGTEVGIFASENAGETWFIPADGPANVSVDELFWMDTTLVAATYGRGIFSIETYEKSTCYTLDLNTDPPDSGFIFTNPPPDCNNGTQYRSGTIVQLTAEPVNSFFKKWSGDVDEAINPTTVRMNRDKAVTAQMELPDDLPVFYYEDFQEGIGTEWSVSSIDITPIGSRKFLGEFLNDDVTLTLGGLQPGKTALIAIDLYLINSWDGNVDPDLWAVTVDGNRLFQTTFSNVDEYDYYQAYPDAYPNGEYPAYQGATEVDTLGYVYYGDSVYRLKFNAPVTSSTLQVTFSASGLYSLSDESWGLDNVSVSLVGGWRGEYFANPDLAGDPAFVRDDQTIDFNWGTDSPHPDVPADNFSTRWIRYLYFDAGVYNCSITRNDGARLIVDGDPIFERWEPGDETNTFDMILGNGWHHFQLEYFEAYEGARIAFSCTPVESLIPPTLNHIDNSDQNGDFTVSWTAVPGALAYGIQERHNGEGWISLEEVTETNIQFTDKSIGDWCFRVQAWGANDAESQWSQMECTSVGEVDSSAPTVDWLNPVGNKQTHMVYGESVALEVSATDNVGITSVDFNWWNDLTGQHIHIAEDIASPYQVYLDTVVLNDGCNQVNAVARDAAGNLDEEYIWVCRYNYPDIKLFLPTIVKGN